MASLPHTPQPMLQSRLLRAAEMTGEKANLEACRFFRIGNEAKRTLFPKNQNTPNNLLIFIQLSDSLK